MSEAWNIRFGTAGTSDSFTAMGYKNSLDIPAYTEKMGLDAFEYQCGHGVRLGLDKARQMADDAAARGILFSVHAPYYISASSLDEEKRLNSVNYLLQSAALCRALGGWRVWECELFVTLEPCPMCAGGIINSRLRRVVYGAADTKAGCCGSVTDLFALPFNHHPVVEKGLREAEAQQLLQAFFVSLREKRAGRPRWKPPVPENRGK